MTVLTQVSSIFNPTVFTLITVYIGRNFFMVPCLRLAPRSSQRQLDSKRRCSEVRRCARGVRRRNSRLNVSFFIFSDRILNPN